MKRVALLFIILISAISCGDKSKETTPPATKVDVQSQDSLTKGNANTLNIDGEDQVQSTQNVDQMKKKLYEFAENKCKCGQQAFQNIGDIDKLSEDQIKEVRTKFKNCIGEFRTGEIIKIMDKNIVDSYMVKNCPQISSTFNRLKNRF